MTSLYAEPLDDVIKARLDEIIPVCTPAYQAGNLKKILATFGKNLFSCVFNGAYAFNDQPHTSMSYYISPSHTVYRTKPIPMLQSSNPSGPRLSAAALFFSLSFQPPAPRWS